MNISAINVNPSFRAKTTIETPEYFISKDEAEKFIEAGEKIGKKTDSIDVEVGDLFKNKYEQDSFIINTKTNIGNVYSERSMILPYDVITPKEYITQFFDKLTKNTLKK